MRCRSAYPTHAEAGNHEYVFSADPADPGRGSSRSGRTRRRSRATSPSRTWPSSEASSAAWGSPAARSRSTRSRSRGRSANRARPSSVASSSAPSSRRTSRASPTTCTGTPAAQLVGERGSGRRARRQRDQAGRDVLGPLGRGDPHRGVVDLGDRGVGVQPRACLAQVVHEAEASREAELHAEHARGLHDGDRHSPGGAQRRDREPDLAAPEHHDAGPGSSTWGSWNHASSSGRVRTRGRSAPGRSGRDQRAPVATTTTSGRTPARRPRRLRLTTSSTGSSATSCTSQSR